MKFWLTMICAVSFAASACAYEPPMEDVKIPLERNAANELIVPDWCVSWYDGCNNCGRMNGQHVCTQRQCKTQLPPYCTKRKGEK